MYCTSVIPVNLLTSKFTREFISSCKKQDILLDYCGYMGTINLKSMPDISTEGLEFYYILSDNLDIQCVFGEKTLTIVLTWTHTYDNYYDLVNESLNLRKILVKRILEYKPEDEGLARLLQKLVIHKDNGSSIYYAFTFYSICDENYSRTCEQHLKVLVEPSVINKDDMLSSHNDTVLYTSKTKVNQRVLNAIKDVDIYSEQKTYVTWASIVSLSRKREVFVKNHIAITLIEVLVQRIWNLCYSQNNILNKYITHAKGTKEINQTIVDTYRILIASKNCVSATYSSRLSSIYSAIVESSGLQKNIDDLEQKLNYLIVFTNSKNQTKNRYLQQSSEILLFLIAIAQVIPIFFNLPIVTNYLIGIGIVVIICVVGVLLIGIKDNN